MDPSNLAKVFEATNDDGVYEESHGEGMNEKFEGSSPPQNPNGNSKRMDTKAQGRISDKDTKRLVLEFIRRFGRGFISGVGLQASIAFIGSLRKKSLAKSLVEAIRNAFSQKSLRTSSFLGLYPAIYHLAVYLLKRRRKSQNGMIFGLAGGVAALSIAVLDSDRKEFFTFFFLARGVGAFVSTLVSRGLLPVIPHSDIISFMACSGVMIGLTFLRPQYMEPGYYRSLVSWTADLTDANMTRIARTPAAHFVTCAEAGIHTGSCTKKRLLDLLKSLPTFFKLYFSIYLIPTLLFKRKALVQSPMSVVKTLLTNTAVSSSFLSLMITTGVWSICWLRNWDHRPPPLPAYIPTLGGTLGSAFVAIERPSRRKELALFMLQQVLQVPYHYARTPSKTHSVTSSIALTAAFSLAMTSIMHAYEKQPAALTSLVTFLVRMLVGSQTTTSP